MWSEGRVRIVDIADELGVSTATVSNVIHGKTAKISKKTVEMVQRKLQERGYIPNMAATLLAENNSRIIGVVMNDHPKYAGAPIEDPCIASFINYLATETERAGYFMMLRLMRNIMDAVSFASMWNMDGMVLIGFCEDEYHELRNAIRIPFVIYDGYLKNGGRISNIAIDNFGGGKLIGEHLRSLGHKMALAISDNDICIDRERFEGFREGFGSGADFLKIPMDAAERRMFYAENLQVLLDHTAIFAVSDYYAADVMGFLIKNGVRVPDDISIAGFDGSPICRQTAPNLTSVRQDPRERAAIAMELLLKMRAEPEYAEDVTLPVTLEVRESTAECTKNKV